MSKNNVSARKKIKLQKRRKNINKKTDNKKKVICNLNILAPRKWIYSISPNTELSICFGIFKEEKCNCNLVKQMKGVIQSTKRSSRKGDTGPILNLDFRIKITNYHIAFIWFTYINDIIDFRLKL